jgi:hypothetical protein
VYEVDTKEQAEEILKNIVQLTNLPSSRSEMSQEAKFYGFFAGAMRIIDLGIPPTGLQTMHNCTMHSKKLLFYYIADEEMHVPEFSNVLRRAINELAKLCAPYKALRQKIRVRDSVPFVRSSLEGGRLEIRNLADKRVYLLPTEQLKRGIYALWEDATLDENIQYAHTVFPVESDTNFAIYPGDRIEYIDEQYEPARRMHLDISQK